MVFTTRLSGGKGGRNGFEHLFDSLGINQKNSRPNHPTTCGKVERFHQTLKRWLAAHPAPATTAELQTLLDQFVDVYNQHRPHRSLTAAPQPPPTTETQSHPLRRPSTALPRPPRQSQPRQRLTAHPRPDAPHRPRPPPPRNPHHHAHQRPRRPRHPRHHRRNPPPTHHRPDPPLPRHRTTHRRTTTTLRTPKQTSRTLNAGSAVSDVSRHHKSALGRIRTCAHGSGGRCSIP